MIGTPRSSTADIVGALRVMARNLHTEEGLYKGAWMEGADRIEELEKERDETREFLREIKTWIIENDYECGDQGSDIFDRIVKIIGDPE